MATNWAELLANVQKNVPLLREANGAALEGFQAIRSASHDNDVLDAKSRELIATAVAVALQCDGCVASHVKQAKLAGASKEEIGAAIGVALNIAAGSAYIYSLKALEAYEQF